MIKMFRDRSSIRQVVMVEDGAAMLPKTLVEIRRGPRDLDDRPPPTPHPPPLHKGLDPPLKMAFCLPNAPAQYQGKQASAGKK